jgi:hypothetical protein
MGPSSVSSAMVLISVLQVPFGKGVEPFGALGRFWSL